MQANLKEIGNLAQQVASTLGMSVLDVKLGQQGKNRTLEVTIYRTGSGVSLSDCEQVSRQLEPLLDEHQPPLIDGSFVLEVQSPGIDRKLGSEAEFEAFAGLLVEVKTKQKVDELGAAFTGTLAGLHDGRVRINNPEKISDRKPNKKRDSKDTAPQGSSVEVDLDNVIHVRLVPLIKPKAETAENVIES